MRGRIAATVVGFGLALGIGIGACGEDEGFEFSDLCLQYWSLDGLRLHLPKGAIEEQRWKFRVDGGEVQDLTTLYWEQSPMVGEYWLYLDEDWDDFSDMLALYRRDPDDRHWVRAPDRFELWIDEPGHEAIVVQPTYRVDCGHLCYAYESLGLIVNEDVAKKRLTWQIITPEPGRADGCPDLQTPGYLAWTRDG